MKVLKITAAIAATALAATAQAEIISGGGLAGADTAVGSTATAVSAIAIVGNTALVDGLRTMQGFPAACAGNLTALCAPSISSAELRSILNNDVANTANVVGGGTNLGTASGFAGKAGGIKEYAAAGVLDAMRAFNSSGAIAGFSCGQGKPIVISNATADDAATLAGAAAAAPSFGFVHATELDGSLGFIKLDGVAPSAIELVSSNYNLVSNLSTDNGVADASVNGVTVGTVAAGAGVASHSLAACSPLGTGAQIGDVNGGAL